MNSEILQLGQTLMVTVIVYLVGSTIASVCLALYIYKRGEKK